MTITGSTLTARRHLGAALTGAALLGVLATPSLASTKARHHHHHHAQAQRAEAPTQACKPGDLLMTGKGKQARLWVCRADGTWTEAVYAVTEDGHTSTVNAGRI